VQIIVDTIVKFLWSLVSGLDKGKLLGMCDEFSFEM
jgi:hypothetical protein